MNEREEGRRQRRQIKMKEGRRGARRGKDCKQRKKEAEGMKEIRMSAKLRRIKKERLKK